MKARLLAGSLFVQLIDCRFNTTKELESSPWSKFRNILSGRVKRTAYSPYKEKTARVKKIFENSDKLQRKKKKKGRRQLLGNCVWLLERMLTQINKVEVD